MHHAIRDEIKGVLSPQIHCSLENLAVTNDLKPEVLRHENSLVAITGVVGNILLEVEGDDVLVNVVAGVHGAGVLVDELLARSKQLHTRVSQKDLDVDLV